MAGTGRPGNRLCKGEDAANRDDCRIEDMRTYKEFVTSPIDLLADAVVEKGLARGRLGVERHSLAAAFMDRLQERLPGATLVDCGGLMDQARMIKTPEEIEALAAAGRATDLAIRGAFERATVGDLEKSVADDIAAGVTEAGADVLNFMFLGTGTRSFEWHARPGGTSLEAGHTLHTDVGGSFTGYWSDVARTAFVGRPGPRERDLYDRLYQVHVETIEAIRPGLRAGDLHSICGAAFEKAGLPFWMAHIGHGIGLGLHEHPMLNPAADEVLAPWDGAVHRAGALRRGCCGLPYRGPRRGDRRRGGGADRLRERTGAAGYRGAGLVLTDGGGCSAMLKASRNPAQR